MSKEPNPTQAEIIRLLKTDEYQTQTEIAEEVGRADSVVSEVKKAYENGELRDPDSETSIYELDEEERDRLIEASTRVGRNESGEKRTQYLQLAYKLSSGSAEAV